MKHNKRLFTAMTDIDTDMITAAAPGKQRKQPTAWKKWLPTAACFALAAIIGVAAWQMNAPEPVEKNKHLYSETLDTKQATAEITTNAELAIIPRWEEMTVTEQFGEFRVGDERFSTRVTSIDAANVGEKLGESTSQGYDIYTDTTYETTLDYYAIHGISTDCALAVKLEGDDSYYVYVNSWYRPETLEELISALNLRENMTFGDFHAGGFNEDGTYQTVRFHDPDDSIVWEWLLSDTTLENVYDQVAWYGSVLSVSVNIPLLGYENISLWVTEDGHLCTNILDTGKAFFLGEERVKEFLYYVALHCTDREVTVYDFGNDDDSDGAVTAGEEEIVEMTTQSRSGNTAGYDPTVPQTANAQTTVAEPYTPANPPATVTSGAYNPQITTSEE